MKEQDSSQSVRHTDDECERCQELLLWYVAGKTSLADSSFVEQHLYSCKHCSREQLLWNGIAGAVESEARKNQSVPAVQPFTASWSLFEERLQQESLGPAPHEPSKLWQHLHGSWKASGDLVWGQLRLLRIEVWLVQLVFLLIAGGILIAFTDWPTRLHIIALSASLCAASSMVFLSGHQADLAAELTETLPVRVGTLFLLRLGIVLISQLLIQLVVSGVLLLMQATLSLDWLLSYWFVPMVGLSAMTLFLTTLWNPIIALLTCSLFWLLRLGVYGHAWPAISWLQRYEQIWLQPQTILPLSLALFGGAYWLVSQKESFTLHRLGRSNTEDD